MDSYEYYNKNASKFISGTIQADMSKIINRFLEYVKPGGTILDAGCGPGRDVQLFVNLGYDVYAMDASEAMVGSCREIIGDKCALSTFQDYHTQHKFDGIWACASLLHLKPHEIERVLEKFISFLKPEGIFFLSFKKGTEDYIKDGRYFNCHTSESIEELLGKFKNIKILENFITEDVRESRAAEEWINMIVRENSPL
jgi:2-polyprenyl-3-methyl-5-hydroxy-6-metoxy-1,4-benzoquinol methylase